MTVYLRDGQWLFVNGQLATGEGCCCGDGCPAGQVLKVIDECAFIKPGETCPEGFAIWETYSFGGETYVQCRGDLCLNSVSVAAYRECFDENGDPDPTCAAAQCVFFDQCDECAAIAEANDGDRTGLENTEGTRTLECCGVGACRYSVEPCSRLPCPDTVLQAGYWTQVHPPGSPSNTQPSPLWDCAFVNDGQYLSDGCYVFREQDAIEVPGFPQAPCMGQPWGFATAWACATDGSSAVAQCESYVSNAYCDSVSGFFFPGEACENEFP